jgi:hypothetical protein
LTAPTLAEAVRRWQAFLAVHAPVDDELEDNFQRLHVEAARFELMRAYYLLGQADQGDAVLQRLDPLSVGPAPGAKPSPRPTSRRAAGRPNSQNARAKTRARSVSRRTTHAEVEVILDALGGDG